MRLPLTLIAALTVTGCVADAEAKSAPRPELPEVEEIPQASEDAAQEQAHEQATLKERIRQVLVDAGQPELVDPCPPCGMG